MRWFFCGFSIIFGFFEDFSFGCMPISCYFVFSASNFRSSWTQCGIVQLGLICRPSASNGIYVWFDALRDFYWPFFLFHFMNSTKDLMVMCITEVFEMMGSFVTRGLVMALGYAYPAYECFKTVERNKPEIDQLRFWCQYWILVAVLTVLERVGDTFISWLPMYSEAKLAFYVYLWYPKTRGTAYVYDSFLRPYVAKHETEIDRNLMELRTRAGDMAVLYWQKAASYGQTRVFEILQYVASQSQRPRPAQQAGVRPPPTAAKSRPPATQQPQQPPSSQPSNAATAQPPSRQTSNAATATATAQPPSRQSSNVAATETGPAAETNAPPPSPASKSQTTAAACQASTESASSQAATPSEGEAMQVESTVGVANGSPDPPPPETVMEDAIRVTRGRLRKTRAAAAKP